MENSNRFEEEEAALQMPDIDMDDMAEAVEDSLQTAADLTKRLGDLNKEMVEYMYSYAQAKATSKWVGLVSGVLLTNSI